MLLLQGFIAPIRALVRSLCMMTLIGLFPIVVVAMIGWKRVFKSTPAGADVRLFILLLFSRFTRILLAVMGVEVTWCVDSARKLDRPALIVANHVSYLDILLISSHFPTAFLAKAEVEFWPIVGPFARALGCVFVSRGNTRSRRETVGALKSSLKRHSVCVFPEGTTTAALHPEKRQWRPGAFRALDPERSALVAVGIAYANQEDLAWIGETSLLPHLFRVLATPRTEAAVTCLAVPVEDLSTHDTDRLTERAFQHVCLGCDVSWLVARGDSQLPDCQTEPSLSLQNCI